ncbi:Enterobactin outer-membrane receptor [Fusobacterium necrophorum subsp. necrophorum]|nr:Enterobactin outer-membrane receptor [Fusobacterium necrophorum subsp. necrophorum]
MQDIPNIHVGTTGWGEIDIRGQGEGNAAKNLQVLIDGAPITTLVNHPLQTNYDVVPVENIERIEIIPGGGSIIYGSGTAGGVINITTNLSRLHRPINIVEVSAGTGGEKYNLAFVIELLRN